jgi:primary-amine oxidase
LTRGKVESNARLGPNVHGSADGEEIIMVEKIALEDERVQAEIAKLKLPEGTVVISDPWIYGILFGQSCIGHILTCYRI